MLSIASPYRKYTAAALHAWKVENQIASLQEYGVRTKKQGRWGSVAFRVDVCVKKSGSTMTQEVSYGYDHKTGSLFLDRSRLWVWIKLTGATTGRPLFTFLRTAYHLSLLHLAVGIIKDLHKKKPAADIRRHAVRSLADIGRIPIYGTALFLITSVGMLLGPFSPQVLQYARWVAGYVENHLQWGEKKWGSPFHTLAPCLQPRRNIAAMALHNPALSLLDSYRQRMRVMIQNDHFPSPTYEIISMHPFIR